MIITGKVSNCANISLARRSLDHRWSVRTTPRQVGWPGRKPGGFEWHLLPRGSWHFAFFTTGG